MIIVLFMIVGSLWRTIPVASADGAQPDDPTFAPVSGDLIGVGATSDQHLFAQVSAAVDAGTPRVRLASFAGTGGGSIQLPSGAVARPGGSAEGDALLAGPDNDPDVDFVRSATELTPAQVDAGLVELPFARDDLVAVVSGGATDATSQVDDLGLLRIYDGYYTDWSQVGGAAGAIHPYLPPVGSDLRDYFLAQLTALNGGQPITLASDVAEAPENDPDAVAGDPGAIEPFSLAAATTLPTPAVVRVEGEFDDRYTVSDVVREADVDDPSVQALLGSTGYLCSEAARSLIQATGLIQLAQPAHHGACGKPTQAPVKDLNPDVQVATTTVARAVPHNVAKVTLSAAVVRDDTGARVTSGGMGFFLGDHELAVEPIVDGVATWTGVSPLRGQQTFTARPNLQDSLDPSTATASTYVKTDSAIATHLALTPVASAPTGTAPGTVTATGKVAVHLVDDTDTPTGVLTAYRGCRALGAFPLVDGSAQVSLPAYRGDDDYKFIWSGTPERANGSSTTVTLHQTGGPSANPLTQCPWGVYKGGLDQAWQPYATAHGSLKKHLATIALAPKAAWFTRLDPNRLIRSTIRSYVRGSRHGDPHKLVQLALFRVDPWEEQACHHLPTTGQQRSYRQWIDDVAAGLGATYAAVILQPDGPFALCAPHHSQLSSDLIAYAARTLSRLPNTSVYIDAGAADWLRDTTSTAVHLLTADGIRYTRGFALNSTHYDSTPRQIRFGAHIARALASAGYPDRHFVVNTAENGQPFKGYTYNRHPTGSSFDNAGVCHSRTQHRCVTLGIPPTTDVDNPRWGLSPHLAALADQYADGYLWFGRPWLDDQARPFDLDRAKALIRSTPY